MAALHVTAAGLVVRQWPGEATAAVFFPDTVSTHLVNALAGAVLEIAATRAVSAQDILSLLDAAPDSVDSAASDDGAAVQRVEETITGLVAAGLLRRVA
jgi:flagellin-like hook-associated protein FlgL